MTEKSTPSYSKELDYRTCNLEQRFSEQATTAERYAKIFGNRADRVAEQVKQEQQTAKQAKCLAERAKLAAERAKGADKVEAEDLADELEAGEKELVSIFLSASSCCHH